MHDKQTHITISMHDEQTLFMQYYECIKSILYFMHEYDIHAC